MSKKENFSDKFKNFEPDTEYQYYVYLEFESGKTIFLTKFKGLQPAINYASRLTHKTDQKPYVMDSVQQRMVCCGDVCHMYNPRLYLLSLNEMKI